MKIEKLQDAIGLIGEDLIEESEKTIIKHKKSKWWIPVTAACLVLAITAGIILLPKPNVNDGRNHDTISSNSDKNTQANLLNLSAHAVAEAKYPEALEYPQFNEDNNDYNAYQKSENEWQNNRKEITEGYNSSMNINTFFESSLKAFLTNTKGENKVYSPLNIYMALGMLAELTDTSTRQQILTALGEKNIESLRKNANGLWRANYFDDGRVTSLLSSSLWLNDKINFKEKTLKYIADTYYSSSYRGEMGSDSFNQALRGWLNRETKNLLKDAADTVEMDYETVLALATTIYFKAAWDDEFHPSATKKDTFHSPSGDIECDFMNKSQTGSYFLGKNFTAIKMHLQGSGSMYLFKPDENTSTDDIINNPETAELIKQGDFWKNRHGALIKISVPKFDVNSQTDLKEPLNQLGIKDAFIEGKADFSPTTDDTNAYVSSGKHAARVMIDEKGCIGAAFTVMLANGTSMPSEILNFKLDRPFVFVVTSATADSLFAGVVNNP